ncbi:MAG: hypothetical protein JJU11_03845 [Candidatus Sumerlaeia bacterium]|nr:hypothetical protein [Candidatus Sumerlaeia bacterium]
MIFDRNNYTDGFQPATDFVVVLGEEAAGQRSFLNDFSYVQPVGNFMNAFGSPDWSNNAPDLEILDNGTPPDTVAGDLIFSYLEFNNAFDNAVAGAEIKAVLRRAGVAADDPTDGGDGWNIQAGGPDDGLTIDGNNSVGNFDVVQGTDYVFKVDAVTGRVGAAQAAAKTLSDPDRGAEYYDAQSGTTTPSTNVNDWLLF